MTTKPLFFESVGKYSMFNEHFENKYPDIYSLMRTYGSMSGNKIASRWLLGMAYTDGPLPFIDQLAFLDKVDHTNDTDLIHFFRVLVRTQNGLNGSDLGSICKYIDELKSSTSMEFTV